MGVLGPSFLALIGHRCWLTSPFFGAVLPGNRNPVAKEVGPFACACVHVKLTLKQFYQEEKEKK